VITKFIEAFFRHKLLILLPPVLIPLIVGPIALMSAPIYYETFTGIWVDRPSYLAYNDGFNNYISPAQNQMNRLMEVLRTRSFIVDVAKRTSLAPLVGSPRGEDRISTVIGTGFTAAPSGDHLLVLHFRADTARLAFDGLNAVVDAFKENAATDRVNQASLAISFYEGRLQTADEDLKKTTTSVRQYIAANPNLSALSSAASSSSSSSSSTASSSSGRVGTPDIILPPSVVDPQLAEMLAQLQFKQKDIENTRAALEQARFDASAGLEGSELGFQIIDPAQLPTAPTRALRKQLVYPIAAMVAGLALSMVTLVVLVAADRSVRSESELPTNARVLGTVPDLKLKLRRLPKSLRSSATRRVIGFVAGTALPAPNGTK
jgi:uncharacterized protein involved in exopolysaccharide biosynthesis